jgi:hypothetical protein
MKEVSAMFNDKFFYKLALKVDHEAESTLTSKVVLIGWSGVQQALKEICGRK